MGSYSDNSPSAWFRSIAKGVDRAATVYVRDGSKVYLKHLIKVWPGTNRSVHIYATDASKRAFARTVRKHTATITNAKRYAGYTEEGYTFRGQRTARSYYQRGATDYGEQAYLSAKPEMDAIWRNAIEAIGNE